MTQPNRQHSFQLRYTFGAPRKAVFAAWTNPDALKQWFRPAGHRPTNVSIDLRVGGNFHIDMETADGEIYFFSGAFEVVKPPAKLVMGWLCSLHDENDTRLTLEFHERDDATEVILTHEGFSDEAAMSEFLSGWPSAISGLSKFVEGN